MDALEPEAVLGAEGAMQALDEQDAAAAEAVGAQGGSGTSSKREKKKKKVPTHPPAPLPTPTTHPPTSEWHAQKCRWPSPSGHLSGAPA